MHMSNKDDNRNESVPTKMMLADMCPQKMMLAIHLSHKYDNSNINVQINDVSNVNVLTEMMLAIHDV